MIILTVRTDRPEAEIGVFDGTTRLAYEVWLAHRKLAETLHQKIKAVLDSQHLDWESIQAVGVYVGPGSFTGLRIGLSVANALAASYGVPICGATGERWREDVLKRIVEGGASKQSLIPEYGSPVHITPQRK